MNPLENAVDNDELESFKKNENKLRKSRYFSLITYATEKQILGVLSRHRSSLRAWCYIYHDKDEAEPHHHIVVRCHSSWNNAGIQRWFEHLKDSSGNYINTFSQPVSDLNGLRPYLLHLDRKSIDAGKHQYADCDIRDNGCFDLFPRNDSFDSSMQIVEEMLLGVPTRELCRRYGRDFVYHYSAYVAICDRIRMDEEYRSKQITTAQLMNELENSINDLEDL